MIRGCPILHLQGSHVDIASVLPGFLCRQEAFRLAWPGHMPGLCLHNQFTAQHKLPCRELTGFTCLSQPGAAQGVFFCPSCPPDRCHGVMRWRAGALLVSRALGADLLILGDSWAELASTTFSEHCPGIRFGRSV